MTAGHRGQRTGAARVVAGHAFGAHVGDPVLELHKDIGTMIKAEPVAGAEVLVDPNAHYREANEPIKANCYRAENSVVQIEEFSLAGPAAFEVTLHPRLTIIRGCHEIMRNTLCRVLPGAFYGFDVASTVRWIGRSGESHVVGPTDAIVPKLTVIHGHEVDTADRMLDLLTMARVPGTARAPGLVVLNEPFADLDAPHTWESLDMLDRLSARLQMLLLTEDPCIEAWAEHRQGKGTLCTIELRPQECDL
jgi:hypothetical protein